MRTNIPVRRFHARGSAMVAGLLWMGSLVERMRARWRSIHARATAIAILLTVAACGAAPPVQDPAGAVRVSEHRNLGEPAWWWWYQGAPSFRLDGLQRPTRERLDGPIAPWPSEPRFLRFVVEPGRDELVDRHARRLANN